MKLFCLCFSTVLMLSVTHQLPAQDTKSRVIPDWGTVVDPEGDCTFHTKFGALTITVPGTPHNLNPNISGVNAPRVVQEVEGNFIIKVKVTGKFQPGPVSTVAPKGHAFHGAGLLIWQDDARFFRFERNTWVNAKGESLCHPPLLQHLEKGKMVNWNPRVTGSDYFQGSSSYFRIERRENRLLASFSHDGKKPEGTKVMHVGLPRTLKIGVAAINTSNQPFEVTFEEFQILKPKR